MRIDWPIRTPLVWSIALGASFGLLCRLAAGFNLVPHRPVLGMAGPTATAVMSLSYLALGSAAIGYITIWYAEMKGKLPIWQWIFVPWCSIFLVILSAALFLLEGTICLAFALPILLFFASVGGVVAGVVRRRTRAGISTHLCVLILPLILPQLETYYPAPLQIRRVQNEIKITAPPATVWKNIASVQPIERQELPDTWTEELGFPRPVSATLSYEGIGGIRNATFERGLSFVETVTVWKPDQRLCFTIKANTAQIPATTLDNHATIGGPYFDVLTGEYEMRELGPRTVMLRLTSRERLSTDFNSYAGLWTDAVMRSIQTSILQVIKRRCEMTTLPLNQ